MSRFLLLDLQHRKHVLVRNKEMINLARLSLEFLGVFAEMKQMWGLGPPLGVDVFPVLHLAQLILVIGLEPSPDDGVAECYPVPEERCLHVLVDHVQPQRQFAEFYGRRIEVDTIDILGGDVCLYLLELVTVKVRRDVQLALLLAVCEVQLGQLVDDLVLERGGSHRGFKNLELEQVLGFKLAVVEFLHESLQGVLHRALGKDLRGIV